MKKTPLLRLLAISAILPFTLALLLVAGCQTSSKPGYSSLAAVLISGSTPGAIREATLEVFKTNSYTLKKDEQTFLVFEREGTKGDRRLYGGWGSSVWMRVEIKIQPYGEAQLLRCDAFVVRNHDDPFFEETQKPMPFSDGPYKKLLAEIQGKVSPPAPPKP